MTLYIEKTNRDAKTLEVGDIFEFALREFTVVSGKRERQGNKFVDAVDSTGQAITFQTGGLPVCDLKDPAPSPHEILMGVSLYEDHPKYLQLRGDIEFLSPRFGTSIRKLKKARSL